jgi:hypothetical protein
LREGLKHWTADDGSFRNPVPTALYPIHAPA